VSLLAAELRSGLSAQKPLPKKQTYMSLRFKYDGYSPGCGKYPFCSLTLSPDTSETKYEWKDVTQQSMTGDALFAKLKSGHFGAAFGKSGHFGAALANASAEDCAKLENFLSGVEQLQWMEKRGASGTHGCWMVCVCTSVIDGHRLCGEFGQGNDCC